MCDEDFFDHFYPFNLRIIFNRIFVILIVRKLKDLFNISDVQLVQKYIQRYGMPEQIVC